MADVLTVAEEVGTEAGDPVAELQEQAEGLVQQLQALTRQLAQAAEAEVQAGQANASQARQAARQAAEAAQQAVEAAQQAVQGWGTEQGVESRRDPTAAFALYEKVRTNPKLQELALYLGWARNLARAKRREKLERVPTEVHSVEMNGDPSKAIPSELALLSDPMMEPLFLRKMVEGQLLQYELRGKERKGRGPIILVRDESGSMRGAKDTIAKAIAVGLLEIAAGERRDFVDIRFSGPDQYEVTGFSKGQAAPEEVIALAERFYNGGTEPYKPLKEALELVQDTFPEGDVVFLSDGDFAEPGGDFLEVVEVARRDLQTRVVSIIIGREVFARRAARFSDEVVPVVNLLRERQEVAERVFGAVLE